MHRPKDEKRARTWHGGMPVAVAAATWTLMASQAIAAQVDDLPAHAPGEVLIQFKHGTGPLEKANALHGARVTVKKEIKTRAMDAAGAMGIVRARGEGRVEDMLRALERHPNVLFAEPNYECQLVATASDPYYTNGSLWGTYGDDTPTPTGATATTNQFGSQAEKAWAQDRTGSSTVLVGVLDEGIDRSHPDLAANMWTNPYDPIDGRDNDGNGYIDDTHGWDFQNNDRTVYDGGTLDRHGTHVAGTIGASANNGVGIAGICWSVRIIPAKFMGASGGYTSDAVEALDYVSDLKRRHGLRIVATNNSWSSSSYSRSLHDAVIRSARENILTVCAAGNSARSNDATPTYPASFSTTTGTTSQAAATYEGVVAVAAIDRYGALASFSNFGATSVDVGAPGASITSTLPGNTYGTWSGTSMAAPHVTGAAALVAAANPTMLASELRSRLLTRGRATASLAGKTVTGARIDVFAALGTTTTVTHDVAVTAVSAPSQVTAGYTPTISVSLANQGNASETFTVSLTDTPPLAGVAGPTSSPQSVTLAAGATRVVYFTWSTTLASQGTHTLTGRASLVSGEVDTADNARSTTSRVMLPSEAPLLFGISPNTMKAGTSVRVTVSGANFVSGASLRFENGVGGTPVVSSVTRTADGRTLYATVAVVSGGPLSNRLWDVRVTNPNGTYARLVQGFLVTP